MPGLHGPRPSSLFQRSNPSRRPNSPALSHRCTAGSEVSTRHRESSPAGGTSLLRVARGSSMRNSTSTAIVSSRFARMSTDGSRASTMRPIADTAERTRIVVFAKPEAETTGPAQARSWNASDPSTAFVGEMPTRIGLSSPSVVMNTARSSSIAELVSNRFSVSPVVSRSRSGWNQSPGDSWSSEPPVRGAFPPCARR